MEKRNCAICGKPFEPVRATNTICRAHTNAEKVRWHTTGSTELKGRGGNGGGHSVPASKTAPKRAARKAPRPTQPIGELDAAGVLRALGWDVQEIGTANGRKLLAVGAGS